jgi:hypothetical protein
MRALALCVLRWEAGATLTSRVGSCPSPNPSAELEGRGWWSESGQGLGTLAGSEGGFFPKLPSPGSAVFGPVDGAGLSLVPAPPAAVAISLY